MRVCSPGPAGSRSIPIPALVVCATFTSRNVDLPPTGARLAIVQCGCERPSRPCVVVLSSDRPFVAFVRAVVAEVAISVCGSQRWESVDDMVLHRGPTLVVLDLSIGQHCRCWATLERLASDPQLRSIPVVVCATASWLLDGHADALGRDGVYVWREPFDPAQLLATVEAAVDATTDPPGARLATRPSLPAPDFLQTILESGRAAHNS